jgi:hypothetical protein
MSPVVSLWGSRGHDTMPNVCVVHAGSPGVARGRVVGVAACEQDRAGLQIRTFIGLRSVRISDHSGQRSLQMSQHSSAKGLQTASQANTPCEQENGWEINPS